MSARRFSRAQGHAVFLVETLVDPVRYRGPGYRAVNWQPPGSTADYAPAGCADHENHRCPKSIGVSPFVPAAAAMHPAATHPSALALNERTPPPHNYLPQIVLT
jgi:hypothetical protein